jgi:basic membrane protein A and related proteins
MKKVLVLVAGVVLLAAGSAGVGGAAPAKTLQVGIVTDPSGLNDRGFNHLAYVGLQEAQKRLGITFRVATSRSSADYIPNLAAFARQGYDLVIGVGYTEIGAMGAVAKRFPKTRFAIVDVANGDLAGKPKNVLGLLFREEQVGYLAGYLAGLEAKRKPGKDVISSVAGEKQPPVDRFIAGYQAGAKKADPGITIVNAYSQDFVDQAKCKSIALNQISAGSVAVFAVAGGCGLGALDAARERNVWGIGVDSDQSFLGPQILTSATKKVDRAVFLAVQSVQKGTFRGGNAIYGLREGGVALGKISRKVPKSEVAAVERIRQQLIAGKIVPPRVIS